MLNHATRLVHSRRALIELADACTSGSNGPANACASQAAKFIDKHTVYEHSKVYSLERIPPTMSLQCTDSCTNLLPFPRPCQQSALQPHTFEASPPPLLLTRRAIAKIGATSTLCVWARSRTFCLSTQLGQVHEPARSVDPPRCITLTERHSSTAIVETSAVHDHGSFSEHAPKSRRVSRTSSAGSVRLVHALQQLIFSKPVIPLSYLVKFHEEHSAQHSTRSYNILIRHSLYLTAYGAAKRLRRQMQMRNLLPDAETTQLTVRLLMRTSRWQDAWQTCHLWSSCPSRNHSSNFLIWLELLGYADHAAIEMPEKDEDVVAPSSLSTPDGEENSRGVMRSPPPQWVARVLEELEAIRPPRPELRVSTQYIYMVALASIRVGHIHQARRITKTWLSSLPKTLTRRQRASCLNVIHLHLSYSPKTTNAHFKHRALVDDLLSLNPCLRPNSTTLFLLLRSLQRAKSRAAIFAVQLVHAYVKRWGAGMVDQRVRRRLCSLATKEGQLGIAKKWLVREERALFHVRRHKLAEDAMGVPKVRARGSVPRLYSSLMPKRGSEGRKWRWLKRRIWKRVTRDHPHGRLHS